jgi:hypothetical protein
MHIDEVLAGRGAPVTQQSGLDVIGRERFPEQRIARQIDLADTKVVGRHPIAIHAVEQVGREWTVRMTRGETALGAAPDSGRQPGIEFEGAP